MKRKHLELLLKCLQMNTYEAFKQVTVAIEESQKHQASLIKRVRAITEEIHEFLAPYLEGLGVIEVLQEADDAMTQKVLYAMLYGTAAFTEEGEYGQAKEGRFSQKM